jgi:hypothetical protein
VPVLACRRRRWCSVRDEPRVHARAEEAASQRDSDETAHNAGDARGVGDEAARLRDACCTCSQYMMESDGLMDVEGGEYWSLEVW